MRSSDPYFEWLCITINNRNYIELARALHSMEFRAKLPSDRNRGMDGMSLRVEFMERHGAFGSSTNRGSCTMLEFLIGIAKHMSFLMHGNSSDHRTAYYFWVLISNLGLDKCTDTNWHVIDGDFYVEDAVHRVLDRQYDYSGKGGLFPLRHPMQDQRTVEIWYQMHSWLGENSDISLDI